MITGAAGGLGAATSAHLVDRGWRVFAADIRPPAATGGVVPIEMDVTDDASVASGMAEVGKQSTGLGGLVNFAGVLRVGGMLDTEPAVLDEILQINVIGSHRVSRAAFDLVRAGKGRIVLISSEVGVQSAAPFNGLYAVSKHAVEAYGDALRRELMFLGVPVIKLRPGPFQTSMVASIVPLYEKAAATSKYHRVLLEAMVPILPREQAKAHGPDIVARHVERALTARRWRPAYLILPDRGRMMMDKLPTRAADLALKVGLKAVSRRAAHRS